jgi:uncharacterized repeat protein (TIGR03803 family)
VFKVDSTGNQTVLYRFTGAGGETPWAGLVWDAQGGLYGTTQMGGAYDLGTVFNLDTTGKETVLYSFSGTPDGRGPWAGLVRDGQGNLYGTTYQGGAYGYGSVFKVDTTGTETMLYSFTGYADGAYPEAGLVQDAQVALYGTTSFGGTARWGTVFEVDPTGTEIVLYNFTGLGDGGNAKSGLVRDAQGNLYGTTYSGGAHGAGTVFKLQTAATMTTTTTTLSSSPNPSTYGQTVTFIATVASSVGAPPDGETVTFMKGVTALGTGALNGGSASLTTSTLWMGTNAITAVYGGDSKFGGSTSKAVKQVVSKAPTTTAVASSQNPSNSGQSVTFTASVMPQFSGTVKGAVTFYDGTTVLKTRSLSGGVAKFTAKTLTSGTHSITATYNGSVSFSGSSASLTQTVN